VPENLKGKYVVKLKFSPDPFECKCEDTEFTIE
jgi:hypothetical protein